MGLNDLLDKFNWIDRAQGMVWSLTSLLPHRKTHKGRKVGGWVVEPGVREIRIDRWENSGGEAEELLKRAHVPIAGRRITDREAIFLVRSRQAAWAELLLMRGGIALGPRHQMIEPANVRYAAGKGAVPLWGQTPADAAGVTATGAGQKAGAKTGLLEQIRKSF